MDDNPRTSRRSKSMSQLSQISQTRKAMCLAVLLASDYVFKAQSALPPSGNTTDWRAREPGAHASSFAQGPRGNTQGKACKYDCNANEHRAVEGSPPAILKKSGLTAQPLGSHTAGATGESAGLKPPSMASGSVPMRRARSAQAPSQPAAYLSLNGDLEIDAGGLIGARVLAMRELLQDAAKNREDEQLLELANGIHQAAQRNRADKAAVDLSLALFLKEASVWANTQGASEVQVAEHVKITAFRDAWSLALAPPPPPNFRNRTELAELYIAKENIPQTAFNPKLHQMVGVPDRNTFVDQISQTRDVAIQYFKQFDDYIRAHLDTAVKAKMTSNLQDAGVGRLSAEFRPDKAWVISEASVMLLDPVSRTYRTIQPFVPDRKEPALLVPAPSGLYLLIRPDGSLKYLNGAIRNEWIQKDVVVRALGVRQPDDTVPLTAPSGGDDGLEGLTAPPQIKFESELLHTPHRPVKIADIVESKVRRHLLSLIETWKESAYAPPLGERVLNFVVPFYEAINRSLLDPRHKIAVSDIAMDTVNLGLTLFSIGTSALCFKGIRTGILAARTANVATASGRASAVMRAVLEGTKTSSFLIQAGKELTDFVVPVFTLNRILHSAARLPWRAAARQVRRELAKLDRAASKIIDKANVLDEIYNSMARGPNHAILIANMRTAIDARATASIPPKLYRGQKVAPSGNILYSPWKNVDAASRDDYLAACIRHSARTGGSMGGVLSLSPHAGVAIRFLHGPEARLVEINAAQDLLNFRTIENIIKEDGPRLVSEGKIKTGTLAAAVRNSLDQAEHEVFYMLGSIPDSMTKVHAVDSLPRNAFAFYDNLAYAHDISDSMKVAAFASPTHGLESVATRLRTMGDWNSDIGDLAPVATANALERRIIIHGHPAQIDGLSLVPRNPESGPPLHITYQPGHYDALIDGQAYEVAGDGDCFFRAVLMSLSRARDVPPSSVRQLREKAAEEVLLHPHEYEPFLSTE
ncbi:OTU domain-containing protein [Paraburkholderia humisilvae]